MINTQLNLLRFGILLEGTWKPLLVVHQLRGGELYKYQEEKGGIKDG
jgi:hypothetical protein